MLQELRNLKFPGTKDAIIFFLQSLAIHGDMSVDDLRILCTHAPGQYQIAVEQMINYCQYFDFIHVNQTVSFNSDLLPFVFSAKALNTYITEKSVEILFGDGILAASMFSFEITTQRFLFHNEMLPLAYAAIRNILVSQGFFVVSRSRAKTVFYIADDYEKLVSEHCKKQKRTMSLEQLKKHLEENAIAGEKAEQFVLSYERRRLGGKAASKVKIISSIDVGAGYDIVSFNSTTSSEYDRFIEVKAISAGNTFFWSNNEYETAKLMDSNYYLYLVDLNKINASDYVPIIIKNPAVVIMQSSEWLIETQSFYVRHIEY